MIYSEIYQREIHAKANSPKVGHRALYFGTDGKIATIAIRDLKPEICGIEANYYDDPESLDFFYAENVLSIEPSLAIEAEPDYLLLAEKYHAVIKRAFRK